MNIINELIAIVGKRNIITGLIEGIVLTLFLSAVYWVAMLLPMFGR